LHRFASAHPDLDVRINASTRLVDLSRHDAPAAGEHSLSTLDDADIGIRFGTGSYPGYRVDKLFSVTVTPVCSPGLKNPKDLPARS